MDKEIIEELKTAQTEILQDKYQTALNKKKFVNEIKNGLGEAIKKNPNKVNVIKQSLFTNILRSIKKFFSFF